MSGSFNMFMMFRSRTAWFTFVVKTLGALLEINTGYQIQVKTVGAHGLAKLISSFVGGIKVHWPAYRDQKKKKKKTLMHKHSQLLCKSNTDEERDLLDACNTMLNTTLYDRP